VHFKLSHDEYRDVHVIGTLFLVNAVAAVVIAGAFVWRPRGACALAALGFALSTLVAFAFSRTIGLFGFEESGLSVDAVVAGVAEIGTIALVAAWFGLTRPRPNATRVVGERQAPPGPTAWSPWPAR